MFDLNTPAPLRIASSAFCTCLGAACMLSAAVTSWGGGGDDEPAALEVAALPLSGGGAVQFEGCVVDESFPPHEGVPVRVLGVDRRLLGHARNGRAGDFQLRPPAGTRVALQADEGGESMTVQTKDRNQRFVTCM